MDLPILKYFYSLFGPTTKNVMYKQDLTLDNIQWLICHKTKPNQFSLVVYHWGLSDSKCLQISRTLQSILAYPNSSLVLIVSILPMISFLEKSFFQTFEDHSTTGITITFIFHNFFSSLARFKYLCIFSLPFFHSIVCWHGEIS